MSITCALSQVQLEKLYKYVFSNLLKHMQENKTFDSESFMKDLFAKTSEKSSPENAAKFLQQTPLMIMTAAVRPSMRNLDIDINVVKNYDKIFNNENGISNIIDTLSDIKHNEIIIEHVIASEGLTRPGHLEIETEEETVEENLRHLPISAFSTTSQEFEEKDPSKTLVKEEIDPDKEYLYKVLNSLKTEEDELILPNGKKVYLKPIRLTNLPSGLRTKYHNDTIFKQNTINKQEGIKKDVYPLENVIALVFTDNKGKFLYFDDSGNLSEENKGKIVYQTARIVRKEGSRYTVKNLYGVEDSILDPMSIAMKIIKQQGGGDLTETYLKVDALQQKEFETLYNFQQSFLEGKFKSLIIPNSVSSGVRNILVDKNVELSKISDYTDNSVYRTMVPLDNDYENFKKGETFIIVDGKKYKVDRSDLPDFISRSIAGVLSDKKISDVRKYDYLKQFFPEGVLDENDIKIRRHFFTYKNKKLNFSYFAKTNAELKKGEVNKTIDVDFNKDSKEIYDIIYNVLSKGKSSKSGKFFPAKMHYMRGLLENNIFDFYNESSQKIEPREYYDILKQSDAKIIMGKEGKPLYNSYIKFSIPTEKIKVLEKTLIEKVPTDDFEKALRERSSLTPEEKLFDEVYKNGTSKQWYDFVKRFKNEPNPIESFAVGLYIEEQINLGRLDLETADKVMEKYVEFYGNGSSQIVKIINEKLDRLRNSSTPQKNTNLNNAIIEENLNPKDTPKPDDKDKKWFNELDLDRKTSLKGDLSKEQIQDAIDWYESSPLNKYIEFNHLANIVNSNAFAKFIVSGATLKNGKLAKVELYGNGNYGDLYHESWHAFSQLFLTKEEKRNLYKELQGIKGNENKTFLELEELLAEDFREYALNLKPKKGQVQRNTLFRKILNFLKALFGIKDNTKINVPESLEIQSVKELFEKLYFASYDSSLLNNYTPLIENVLFGELNRGAEQVRNKKEIALNRQDSNLVVESIDSIISELIDEVSISRGLKGGTVAMFKNDNNKTALYKQVKQILQERLDSLRKELNIEAPSVISKVTDKNDLEQYSVAKIKSKKGEHKYVFLSSQIDTYEQLNLSTKGGERIKGELYSPSKINIVADFYNHSKIKVNGKYANILVVNSLDEAKEQFMSYNAASPDNFSEFVLNEQNEVKPLTVEQSEIQDLIRILESTINNFGDSKQDYMKNPEGIIKYHLENSRFDIVRTKIEEDASDEATDETETEAMKFDKKVGQTKLEEMASKETLYILKSLFKIEDGKHVNNRLGFKQLANFKNVWVTMVRAIDSEKDPEKMYQKVSEAAKNFPELRQLIDTKLPNPTFENLTESDFDITTAFWQDFKKPRIPYYQATAYFDDGEYNMVVSNASADVSNLARKYKAEFKASPATRFIKKTSENKSYLDVSKVYDTFSDREGKLDYKKAYTFLKSIGFYLDDSKSIIEELKNPAKVNYYGLSWLFETVSKINEIDKSDNVSKEERSYIELFKTSPLDALSEEPPASMGLSKEKNIVDRILTLQVKYGLEGANFSVLNAEKNRVQEHTDDNSASMYAYLLNNVKNKTDLWKNNGPMSYLNPKLNPFTNRSQLLNNLFELNGAKRESKNIELFMSSGTQIEGTNEGSNTTSLDSYGKFLQEFNGVLLKGIQEFTRPGSKSSSFGYKLNGGFIPLNKGSKKVDSHLYIDINDFSSNKGEETAYEKIIMGYLASEVDRINNYKSIDEAKNYIGYNRKIKINDKEHIAGESFMVFQDVLSGELKKEILDKVQPGTTLEDVIEEDAGLKENIKKAFRKYFNAKTEETFEFLQEAKFIDKDLFNKIQDRTLSQEAKEKILVKAYLFNAWIHNFETVHLIYGDVSQYNHLKEEFHKRTSSIVSGGPGFRTDMIAQDFINNNFNTYDSSKNEYKTYGGKRFLETKDDKFVSFKYDGRIRTAIIKDIQKDSIYKDEIEKGLREQYTERYIVPGLSKEKEAAIRELIEERVKTESEKYTAPEIKEGDGGGYITFDAYRTLKKLQKNWTPVQELLYKKIIKGEKVSVEQMIETFPAYKLQYSGPLSDTKMPVLAFHKFALIPLIPSVIQGSDLEKLHERMLKNNVQYVTYESGSKVGIVTSNGKPDNIYDNEGNFIEDQSLTHNIIYPEFLKEVTSVPNAYKSKVVFSTQLRKLILEGLYNVGEVIKPEYKKYAEKYKNIVDTYTSILKEELLQEIGFSSDNPDDINLSKLMKIAISELGRKGLPEHLQKTVKLDINGHLLSDLSLHSEAEAIEKTIMSIVEKRLVKQKLKGEALVQVPVSMTNGLWDKELRLSAPKDPVEYAKYAKEYLGSTTLPFYRRDENNNTKPMKVAIALQGDFKNLLNVLHNDGEKIETIERLNEMIKNDEWMKTHHKKVRITAVRIPVQGLNSMEFMEIYHFLDPAAGQIIIPPTELVSKSGGDFDVDKLTTFMPNIDGDGNLYEYDTTDYENIIKNIKTNVLSLEEKDKLKALKSYKKALENELLNSIVDILQLPFNYANLVRPNDTYILKSIADDLQDYVVSYDRFKNVNSDYLKSGKKKVISPTRILEPLYNLHKHDVNMIGKDVLGIAANENALHPVYTSIGAKMPATYKMQSYSNELGRSIDTGSVDLPLTLRLPHNIIVKNGIKHISLSHMDDVNGINRIAELFSQAINGTVDVEKDPWIFFIQGNLEIAPTLFFLFKAGVPVEDAIYFASNPLIREYGKQLRLIRGAYSKLVGAAPENPTLSVKKAIENTLRSFGLESYINLVSKKKLYSTLQKQLNKPNVLNAQGFYSKEEMYNLITGSKPANSDLSVAMFLDFINLQNILTPSQTSLKTLKSISKPDAANTFKSLVQVKLRENLFTILDNSSLVDSELVKNIKEEKIYAGLYDKELIKTLSKSIFPLTSSDKVVNYLSQVLLKNSGTISTRFGIGDEGQARFATEFKSGIKKFMFQNYVSNFVNEDGYIIPYPDNYKGLNVVETSDKNVKVKIENNTIYINPEVLSEDYKKNKHLRSNSESDSYMKQKLASFAKNMFDTESSFFKFMIEKAYIQETTDINYIKENKYYKEFLNTFVEDEQLALEYWSAQEALFNSFNYYAIAKNEPYSFTDRVMNLINEFPDLKNKFPILEQMTTVTLKDGVKLLTLNDRSNVKEQVAEIYYQNLKDLANLNVKKADNYNDNKRISDVFKLLPLMMYYQHGADNSTYGFNMALPFDTYEQIMQDSLRTLMKAKLDEKTFSFVLSKIYDFDKYKNFLIEDSDYTKINPEIPTSISPDGDLETDESEDTTVPGSETSINIYAGTRENADLSNFATRPFTYKGQKFISVEQAFQYAKGEFYNTYEIDPSSKKTPADLQAIVDTHLKNILKAKTGAEAKALGRKNIGISFENDMWDDKSSIIMKDLLIESFKQNPDALKRLLDTGNATLTHTQDKSKWGTEFPRLLMEVRNELRSTQPITQTIPSVSENTFKATAQPTVRKTYSGKVTSLQPNQIFVFGSNPEGRHGAGAAKIAKDKFGAIYGQGEGLQGQSYALPTKDLRIKTNNSLRSISAADITNNIKKLYEVAKQNPTKEFLVSDYSESNLNGYTGQEMADMFTAAGPIPSNIVFNENFDKLIVNQLPQQTSVSEVKEGVQELFESNPELANAVYEALGFNQMITPNDRIVFGHPTIGKSFLKNKGEDKFISLDDDYATEINSKVKEIADKYNVTTYQVKDGGTQKWNNEYNQMMQEMFNVAKQRVISENKTLFTSNTNLLKNNAESFDKVINLTDKEFERRIQERGAKYDIKIWKSQINDTISKLPTNKVINTDKYLSDLFITPQQKQQALQLYSSYLDTIFPDSQVKDIVYHGEEKKDIKFYPLSANPKDFSSIGNLGKGIYFSDDIEFAKKYAKTNNGSIATVILNTVNARKFSVNDDVEEKTGFPAVKTDGTSEFTKIKRESHNLSNTNDSLLLQYSSYFEVVVYSPEQIHILGSKQDIEGFKKFVTSKTFTPKQLSLFDDSEEITNFTDQDEKNSEDLDNNCETPFL